jgi:homospermidine synthase
MSDDKMIRTSLYISENLVNEVNKIAEDDDRSFSFVASTLMWQAIKVRERDRIRKKKPKVAAKDNS